MNRESIVVQVQIQDDPNVHRIELDLTTVDPFSTLKDEIIMRFQQDVSPPIRYDLFSVDLKEFVLNFGKIQIQSSEEFLGAVTRNSSTGAIMMVATVKRKNGVMDRAQIPKVEDPSSDDDIDSKSTEPEESSEAKTKPKKAKAKTKTDVFQLPSANNTCALPVGVIKQPVPPPRDGGNATGKCKAETAPSSAPSSAQKKRKCNKEPVRDKILRALAELGAVGITECLRLQAAIFAGYKNVSSAGFAKALSALKREGLIEYPTSKTVRLTRAGLETEETRGVDPPEDNAAVHERIKKLLKPKQKELFEAIKDGLVHTREDVATAMGYTNQASSGYQKALSGMKSLGLVYYPKDGSKKLVQLTDVAFPFELRGNDNVAALVAMGSTGDK